MKLIIHCLALGPAWHKGTSTQQDDESLIGCKSLRQPDACQGEDQTRKQSSEGSRLLAQHLGDNTNSSLNDSSTLFEAA